MRAVVQRMVSAEVTNNDGDRASIGLGLLVFLGVADSDSPEDAHLLADKVRYLRIFEDHAGKMNLDLADVGGAVLCISAFSLLADARKGRRPAFAHAAAPEIAEPLYRSFCETLAGTGVEVQRGFFQSYMQVKSVNDGPICILLDSKKEF